LSKLHPDGRTRCSWCGDEPSYVAYHDKEWGVPEWDDRALFEKLLLDGFQAGLSWFIILRKRDNFRLAFDEFSPERIVQYDDAKLASLMADPGIVRNKAKINAAVGNARVWLDVQETGDGFSSYLWSFVGGAPIINRWPAEASVPTETAQSRAMSKDLKKRGFKFCGPTICYAFMQAVGMINDHAPECFRHSELDPG
jgi:DNA-3-methyladenine glycosylase I